MGPPPSPALEILSRPGVKIPKIPPQFHPLKAKELVLKRSPQGSQLNSPNRGNKPKFRPFKSKSVKNPTKEFKEAPTTLKEVKLNFLFWGLGETPFKPPTFLPKGEEVSFPSLSCPHQIKNLPKKFSLGLISIAWGKVNKNPSSPTLNLRGQKPPSLLPGSIPTQTLSRLKRPFRTKTL